MTSLRTRMWPVTSRFVEASFDTLSSRLTELSGGKLFRGTFRRDLDERNRPQFLLELYSFEACPACRKVRRTLTELDLDFIHRSCPKGASPKRRDLAERGGKITVPYLIDPNTGVELYESDAICAYLERVYGQGSAARTAVNEPARKRSARKARPSARA